nr:polysaccharide deacetylase family protein [uncultured Flavobacterium sp.]
MDNGLFCISLDFEKYWGMRDKIELDAYKVNLLAVNNVVDQILKIFENNSIHSTWATVGFLFFENKEDLLINIKDIDLPDYDNNRLTPYPYIYENDLDPVTHFSANEIKKIINTKFQEVATHTFSHFYCLEEGQKTESFDSDLLKAVEIASSKFNIKINSIVFPRNQVNKLYLKVLSKYGVKSFRSNPDSFIYIERNSSKENNIIRLLRLIDSYINLTGFHGYEIEKNVFDSKILVNIKASMFLRPFNRKLKSIEIFKILRIKKAMTNAAKKNKIFHLWWHPHNFGNNLEENMNNLRIIIDHFKYLENKFGMQSMNMEEITLMSLNDGK